MRKFDSGATRDTDAGKLHYRRFFSPRVLKRRAQYMETHRIQADGVARDPDNWKKGIPLDAYADSAWRHHHEFWQLLDEGQSSGPEIEEAICALMFNLEGYLDTILREENPVDRDTI